MDEGEALAKSVIRKSLRIEPGESVIVESWSAGLDIAEEIVYQLRTVGARPMLLFEDEETYWRSVETLPKAVLGQVSRSEWAALAEADGYIFLPGPTDIDRICRNREKFRASIVYNPEWYRRAEKAGLRGARLLLSYITKERAALYALEYGSWRSAVFRAALADYGAIARTGRRVVDILSRDAEVEITAPNGTFLTFRLKGRPAKLEDGIVDARDVANGDFMTNIPPGYVYVAPDEGSAEGSVYADQPVPFLGAMVSGVRFAFEGGYASWAAAKHEAVIRSVFDGATGLKSRFASICIGLNPEILYGFLQDGIVQGAVEVSIGDNSAWGGRNRSSFYLGIHLSKATIRVGGKMLVKAGRLSV